MLHLSIPFAELLCVLIPELELPLQSDCPLTFNKFCQIAICSLFYLSGQIGILLCKEANVKNQRPAYQSQIFLYTKASSA